MENGSGGISASGMFEFVLPLFLKALFEIEGSEFSLTGSGLSSLDFS